MAKSETKIMSELPQVNGKPRAAEGGSVVLEVPRGPLAIGYVTTRFEVTGLTVEQADALNRLTTGLRMQNARCQRRDARTALGIVVDKEADSIRWLLDQLAAG